MKQYAVISTRSFTADCRNCDITMSTMARSRNTGLRRLAQIVKKNGRVPQ